MTLPALSDKESLAGSSVALLDPGRDSAFSKTGAPAKVWRLVVQPICNRTVVRGMILPIPSPRKRPMSLTVRRVVTGHDDNGRAIVSIDETSKNVVQTCSVGS
jgi:hypothetical protein